MNFSAMPEQVADLSPNYLAGFNEAATGTAPYMFGLEAMLPDLGQLARDGIDHFRNHSLDPIGPWDPVTTDQNLLVPTLVVSLLDVLHRYSKTI